MKKIFSLLAAVLFAGGMFATEETVTFSAQGYSNGDAITSYEGSSFSIAFDKGTNSNAPKYYTTGSAVRCYGGNYFTITSSSTMTSISMTFDSGGGTNAILSDPDGFETDTWTGSANSVKFTIDGSSGHRRIASITVVTDGSAPIVPPSLEAGYYLVGSKMGWSAASGYKFDANPSADGEYMLTTTLAANDELKVIYFEDDDIVSWYPSGNDNNYVVDAAHAGAKTIYFRPAGNSAWESFHQGGFFFIEANLDPDNITTCAEAARAALSVSGNNVEYNNGHVYTIRGYVTGIHTAYNAQYHNVSFWMADEVDGGQVLQAYRCEAQSAEDVPNVGDLVDVTGKLTKYGTTPEFAAGCTFQIVTASAEPENLGAKSIAEFLTLKNAKDTCILTGAVKNIRMVTEDEVSLPNIYGNFDLEDETGSVYVYGLLTAAGENKKFREMDIDENDILTIKALYAEHQGTPQVQNAIFVSVQKAPTAIDNIEVVKTTKVIRNGQVVIIREGVEYNMLGTEVK